MASSPRLRRLLLSFLSVITTTAALVLGLLSVPASAAVPSRMASLGDSITRGFNACGWYVDCPSSSWSTGSNSAVNSHYLRLRAQNSSLVAYNDAATGAKVSALAGQAQNAVSQGADYVTILIGANDVCTSSESTMTSVADFESRFRAGMNTLRNGLPNAKIFVASIPDIRRLWQVGKDNLAARAAWSAFGICQSMLANPTSNAEADVARRERVRQRVIAFNNVLANVCAEYANCKFDGNAVFNYPFTLSQVSGWDYFHPNESGQAVLAAETYKASFWA
ncbi:lipoprotein [Actinomadura rubrobrunea]|uniref:Lipoprotein n=1 Tax=Actinomadura rubrobrunea TaxID=115335 RepID=A0A9W6PV53_9ACTN|nr:SGNH/GDSL hydrolase family protein [Actinomadura rubrobrunea]GLW63776.1 lipoprotein [Actinomadura rubrobrunea]